MGEAVHLVTDAHPPRKDSATYNAARKVLMHTRRGGCMVCGGVPDLTHPELALIADSKGLQDHHGGGMYVKDVLVALNLFGTEWSLGWSADPLVVGRLVANMNVVLAALGEPTYSAPVTTTAEVMAYVDSVYNANIKLCFVPGTPVLMANGSQRAIEEVQLGDLVVGADGLPHEVTGTMNRPFSGRVRVVDGVGMTLDHPVLIPDGWVEAQALTRGLSVLGAHMSEMVRVETKILRPVINGVPVDVVNNLARGKRPTEQLLHNVSVFHDGPSSSFLPHSEDSVAARRVAVDSVEATAGYLLKTLHSFLVGLAGPTALVGAEQPLRSPTGGHHKSRSATLALLPDAPANGPWTPRSWRPIRQVRGVLFRGTVFDLTVRGAHSFIVGDSNPFVVHNCAPHHVGRQEQHTPDAQGHEAVGIHEIPFPIWLGQVTDEWDRWDMWAGTTGTLALAHPDASPTGVHATVLHANPYHHPGVQRGDHLPLDHVHVLRALVVV